MKRLFKTSNGCAMLCLLLLLLGCGLDAQVGPTDDMVKLEYEENIRALGTVLRAHIELKSVEITKRIAISKDSVKFHLNATFGKQPEFLVAKLGKIPDQITVIYQLMEDGQWEVTKRENGHH